jgi:hypothetical protein
MFIKMKKIVSFLIGILFTTSSVAQIPFSFIKMPASTYDVDAKALFDSIGDVPQYAKNAWNARVIAMKANGQWSGSVGGYPFLPTRSMTNVLRDGKTKLLTATFGDVLTGPYYVGGQSTGGVEGINFYAQASTFGNGFVLTGIIPSATLTLNNSCFAIGFSRDEAAIAGYSCGAFQGASQSMIFQKRSVANLCETDQYGTTIGTGRLSQSSATGAKGVYLSNRRLSTDFKLYRDQTQIATASSSQGSLPTVEMYLNCYNSSGTPSARRNQPISFFWVYGAGMTSTQALQETADWKTFLVAMERNVTWANNVVVDGNSHTAFYRDVFFREIQYVNSGIGFNAKYSYIGLSGTTTTAMLSTFAANVPPLYDAAATKNSLVPWEATNDISSGSTIDSVEARYKRYCLHAQALGFKVLAMPCMSRDFSGDTTKIMNTYYFNEWLAANWATFANAVVDPNDPYLGNHYYIKRSSYASTAAYATAVQALTDNLFYFADGNTHLSPTGYQEWAYVVAIKLRTITMNINLNKVGNICKVVNLYEPDYKIAA